MTQEDLIRKIAEKLEWSETKSADVINGIIELLIKELSDNNEVVLDEFGAFTIEKKSEFISVNPDTGERYLMPPSIVLLFESHLVETIPNFNFDAEESLKKNINSAFRNFEPTLLNESVTLESIEEVIEISPVVINEENISTKTNVEKSDEVIPNDLSEIISKSPNETISGGSNEIIPESSNEIIPESSSEIVHETFSDTKEKINVDVGKKGSKDSAKRNSSILIPIMGGAILVIASLFFFKRNSNKKK